MTKPGQEKLHVRLKRIEGQVAGIRRMSDDGKPCAEILVQIAAVQAALGQESRVLLSDFVEESVGALSAAENESARRAAVTKLLEMLRRYGRLEK